MYSEDGSTNKYRKIVAWDFDNTMTCVDDEQPDAYRADGGGIITYPRHLKAVLDILDENKILSVPASQRCAYRNGPGDIAYKEAMYRTLDGCFGKDRRYLLETHGESAAQGVDANVTGCSKNDYLKNIQDQHGVSPENIILVDDNLDYREPAIQVGYRFLSVDRRPYNENLADYDRLYLIRVLQAAGLTDDEIITNIATVEAVEVRKDLQRIYDLHKAFIIAKGIELDLSQKQYQSILKNPELQKNWTVLHNKDFLRTITRSCDAIALINTTTLPGEGFKASCKGHQQKLIDEIALQAQQAQDRGETLDYQTVAAYQELERLAEVIAMVNDATSPVKDILQRHWQLLVDEKDLFDAIKHNSDAIQSIRTTVSAEDSSVPLEAGVTFQKSCSMLQQELISSVCDEATQAKAKGKTFKYEDKYAFRQLKAQATMIEAVNSTENDKEVKYRALEHYRDCARKDESGWMRFGKAILTVIAGAIGAVVCGIVGSLVGATIPFATIGGACSFFGARALLTSRSREKQKEMAQGVANSGGEMVAVAG